MYFLVVNYNSFALISRLLASIINKQNCQILIINNSPKDGKIHSLKSERVNIINLEKNLGFGKACNLGLNWIAERDNNALVWLINPDAYFYFNSESKLSPFEIAMAIFKKYPALSILGTSVYNSKGELTSAGGTFTPDTAALSIIDSLPKESSQDYIKTDWVSGCSLLINLANFNEVPQFCDRFFLYYEDLDFCLRYAQRGHQIGVTHLIKVFHDTSTITNRNTIQKYRHITKSYLVYIEKYGSKKVFRLTNFRMFINTIRLLFIKPKQGLGKAIGIYEYWRSVIDN